MPFSAIFQKGWISQAQYMVLIYVARWRHNFREIAVQKLRKVQNSAEKLVRIDS